MEENLVEVSAAQRRWVVRWLPVLPAVMLVVFGALNLWKVRTQASTPFFSGGFGMHSTYTSPLFRFFRVYRIQADGTEQRVEIRQPPPFEPALHLATPARLRRMVSQRAARPGILPSGTYRVELWQFRYGAGYTTRDAGLTIDLVSMHTLEISQ